jgi:hypothetical protein
MLKLEAHEMSLQYQIEFSTVASKFAQMGAYVVPAEPEQKVCKLPEWQNKATRELRQIIAWNVENPRYNVAIVGKPEIGAVWGFDDDSGILAEYEAEHGQIKTYRTKTVSGGMHLLFMHNQASIDMGNLSAKNKQNQELWSARTNNRYVISAGSVAHPHNDPEQPLTAYTAIDTSAPIEAPDSFIAFLRAKAGDNKPTVAPEQPETVKVHEGGRNNYLASRLGKAHHAGVRMPELLTVGIQINEEHCVPPLPDSEVRQISESISKYQVKESGQIIFESGSSLAPTAAESTQSKLKFDIDSGEGATRPEFPRWCMVGTSLYENLAKPVSEVNSKYPELIWLPAVQLMMNALQGNVKYDTVNTNLNLFLGIVSPPGKFFKSSSCELAHEFFKYAGLADTYQTSMRNSEGKTIILQAGSSEGFGLRCAELNAKKAILWNDELGRLVAKAGVENSSLPSDLLQFYESGYFGNNVTNKRNSFSFPAGSYCFGWTFCTTTKGFNKQWPKLAGTVSGLEDRMFFLVTPEKPKELVMETYVPIHDKAVETRKLFDAAISQNVFQLVDTTEAQLVAGKFDNPRSMNMLFKFALYFAVDLGKQIVDESCLERAAALVKYREQAAAYLAPIEADNAQARLQQEIIRELKQNRGRLSYRELCRELSYNRTGSYQWNQAFNGLIADEYIFRFEEPGNRGQTRKMVGLRKWDDE